MRSWTLKDSHEVFFFLILVRVKKVLVNKIISFESLTNQHNDILVKFEDV